jgi:hypothetical protein
MLSILLVMSILTRKYTPIRKNSTHPDRSLPTYYLAMLAGEEVWTYSVAL